MTHTEIDIDWLACELIEQIPGKVSGRPIVRGTRILPDAIVDSYDLGKTLEELREGFPSLSVAQINRLIECSLGSEHEQRNDWMADSFLHGVHSDPDCKRPVLFVSEARL